MGKKITVILLEDVPGAGRSGDIVDVAEGFARNQLFPFGRAALANSPQGQGEQQRQEEKKVRKKELIAKTQKTAEQLDGTELLLPAKVKEGEEIFGSITAKHIAQELVNQSNVEVEPKNIEIEGPIKSLGTYTATISLMSGIECQIQVTVVDEDSASRNG